MQIDGNVHLAGNIGQNLFSGDASLTDFTGLGLAGFETSQLTPMEGMFQGCTSLASLTIPGTWDASKVTTMQMMFYSCSNL